MFFARNAIIQCLATPTRQFNPLLTRNIKRWVAPTMKELRRRREKMGPEAIQARSTFLEWNHKAELFSFAKRINETFEPELLQQAFTYRSFIIQEEMKQRSVGIEQPETNLTDNQQLIVKGERLISEYVTAFLITSLPNLPEVGIKELHGYLTNEESLANISNHLGTRNIILSDELPVTQKTMAETVKSVVGALHLSGAHDESVYKFVRDFVCTQLNQLDLATVWQIDQPLEMLKEICKKRTLGEPEARLIGDLGKNTILAVYQIGIYCNKQLIGTGFGESVDVAIEEAARNCLMDIFGIQENMKPFNFELDYSVLVKAARNKAQAKDSQM